MTVMELFNKLKNMPANADVIFPYIGHDEFGHVYTEDIPIDEIGYRPDTNEIELF